ncbi:MAG: hypothetical protein LBN33_06660 [Desulfovibrio sp.]|nr:hypothetical protein [Desulfovibrio sp.]
MRTLFFAAFIFALYAPQSFAATPDSGEASLALSPALELGEVFFGESAATGSAETRKNGWVRMEEGARPAYVGIHGGTAPLSLLRSSEGAIFALTGNTGNDFSRILRRDATRNGTELTPDVAVATFSPLPDEDLTPFGLSNPEGVSASMSKTLATETYLPASDLSAIKPLKLKSYIRLLTAQ